LDPNYANHYRELYEKHWWWRAREEILCDELRQHLLGKPRMNILDVGCGDGLFFERLREFGDVEGVESDASLVNANGPDREWIRVGNFDSNFQPNKRYGLILMLDVLEHLDAPQHALSQAISLLTPEGVLVITVPAFRLLWTNHDRLNEHRTRFTKASFRRLAESAGMEISAMRYFFAWMFPAKLAARAAEIAFRPQPGVPRIPPASVNTFLRRASYLEDRLTRKLHVPFGSSLLVFGRRARANDGVAR
jgi:2-polyprenyl-3-methyl-5-hydroxy-6-metoxy-1,4-benzoquinol methylase